MKTRTKKYKKYSLENFFVKLGKFYYWFSKDLGHIKKFGRPFSEIGMTCFAGRQGGGKSMAMSEYLLRMKAKYPNVKIYTNYGFKYQDGHFNDWNDFFTVRNGDDGVIFAIDEIQNEFSSTAWKNFPETLLSEITQQRKQKIKIVCTSQVFSRMAKPLREQTYEVVECVTLLGRWTFTKCFDADDYNAVIDRPEIKHKIKRKWRKNFVQDDFLRNCYDSYAKIERMKRTEYFKTS